MTYYITLLIDVVHNVIVLVKNIYLSRIYDSFYYMDYFVERFATQQFIFYSFLPKPI